MHTNKHVERMTVEDYLRMERESEERHIYIDGRIVAMAGESGPHGDISFNLADALGTQLKGTPCRGRMKDTKVRSGGPGPWNPRATSGLFSYPDVVIICGEVEYHDEHRDVVLNPTVIIEVLSPSTETFDRGEKFERYERWNLTLTDYLLVRQNRPHIEHYTRQPDGRWLYTRTAELDATIKITSVGVTLQLADVYDRVEFPELLDSLFAGDSPPETPNS